jgi:hypothetical protein
VRCADGFVLLIKEETLLQNMINWLTNWNGNECGKN